MKKLIFICMGIFVFGITFGYNDCEKYKEKMEKYDEITNLDEIQNLKSNITELKGDIKQLELKKKNVMKSLKNRYPNLSKAQLEAFYRDEVSDINYQLQTKYASLQTKNEEYGNLILNAKQKYNKILSNYKECIRIKNETIQRKFEKANDYFKKGNDLFDKGYYRDAIDEYNDALDIYNKDNSNYDLIKNNLHLAYYNLGGVLFNKEKYNEALDYLKKADNYRFSKSTMLKIYTYIAGCYAELQKFEKANKYIDKAEKYSSYNTQFEQLSYIKQLIKETEKNEKLKENAPTNDIYSWKQYRLKKLDITEAWKKVDNPKEVTVAVIDNGVNINHPDITNNMWTNTDEEPGNNKDDDNNGYIDDYNGWNFLYDNNNVLPLGSHGTQVAGILGAEIKSYNNEGIAGIIKNVEIMPIGACITTKCRKKDIKDSIEYAIDNGADIINLSLQGNQFDYSDYFDDILNKAYNKNIVVVNASGNGDLLDKSNGVNTTVNKISPLCNGDKKETVFGVGSFDRDGYRSSWSNYGNCVEFYGFGEDVFSTSIEKYDNYGTDNGTSFAAPMIAGIIGLGYNKYGEADVDLIYDSLKESYTKNKAGNTMVNASKFLNILGNKIENKEKKEKEKQHKEKLKNKAKSIFEKLTNILDKYPENVKKQKYEKIVKILNKYKEKASGDKLIVINHLLQLIKNRNSNDENIDNLLKGLIGK